MLERARPVEAGGLDVLVAALRGDEYVEGVSLVVAQGAWTWPTATRCVLLVEMEERVFVTARSRVAALDVAEVLQGGGRRRPRRRRLGHRQGPAAGDGPAARGRRPRARARGGADGAPTSCRSRCAG